LCETVWCFLKQGKLSKACSIKNKVQASSPEDTNNNNHTISSLMHQLFLIGQKLEKSEEHKK
jgi:hypothetical protein